MIRCHLIYSKADKKLSQNRSENIFSRWSEFLRLWVVEVWDSNNDWHVDCFIRTSLPRNLTHYGAPSTKTIFSGRTCVKKKTQHTDIWRKLILIQWTDIKLSKWQQIANYKHTRNLPGVARVKTLICKKANATNFLPSLMYDRYDRYTHIAAWPQGPKMGPLSYLHSSLPKISGVWILPYCIGDRELTENAEWGTLQFI